MVVEIQYCIGNQLIDWGFLEHVDLENVQQELRRRREVQSLARDDDDEITTGFFGGRPEAPFSPCVTALSRSYHVQTRRIIRPTKPPYASNNGSKLFP